MWNIRNGPVVVDGVSTSCVPMMIVPAPLGLHALWGRETRVWGELLPHTISSIRSAIIIECFLVEKDKHRYMKRISHVTLQLPRVQALSYCHQVPPLLPLTIFLSLFPSPSPPLPSPPSPHTSHSFLSLGILAILRWLMY